MITITAAIVTLGCRLNQADSALLCDRLAKAGFKIVEEDGEDSPNLIVVNSCAVTATAARKTRQSLASLRRKHPYAYIILTGCAAEADPDIWQRVWSEEEKISFASTPMFLIRAIRSPACP